MHPSPPFGFVRAAAALVLWGVLSMPVASAQDPPAPPLMEELLSPLTKERAWRDAKHAVQIVNVRTGEEVFSRGADRKLVPASTMKIVTTAAALSTLGPSYKFKTTIFRDGQIDAAGTLHGDLYVQGGGDPTFVIEKMWKLLYDLKMNGLRKVDGDVVFDESFFRDAYTLPGWDKPEDVERGPSYFSRASALSLNFNTVSIVVKPGLEVGKPAVVVLETPAAPYVVLESSVKTASSRSYRRLAIERTFDADHLSFNVTGSMPSGARAARYYRTVEDPTAHFQSAFMAMAVSVGIKVTGRGRRGIVPDSAKVQLELRSPPLGAILMDMNKYSNNFMAEQVLRTMGAEMTDGPGSTAAGLQVVREYLDDIGVPRDSYTLANGSGLSRKGKVPPSLLTAVLIDMAKSDEVGSEFRGSLAIGGTDGTLRKRLRDTPARLRGKTGTIDGVHCLTGYATSADGELYAFAYLANGIRGGISRVKRLHDEFSHRIFALNGDQSAVVQEE